MNHLRQQFSGTADKGFSLGILIRSGAFSNEHQRGLGYSVAEDQFVPAGSQRTSHAVFVEFPEFFQASSLNCGDRFGFLFRWDKFRLIRDLIQGHFRWFRFFSKCSGLADFFLKRLGAFLVIEKTADHLGRFLPWTA